MSVCIRINVMLSLDTMDFNRTIHSEHDANSIEISVMLTLTLNSTLTVNRPLHVCPQELHVTTTWCTILPELAKVLILWENNETFQLVSLNNYHKSRLLCKQLIIVIILKWHICTCDERPNQCDSKAFKILPRHPYRFISLSDETVTFGKKWSLYELILCSANRGCPFIK